MKCEKITLTIPTYLLGPDDPNPIFYEKRNVQGASGEVFPMAMNETVTDEKADRPHEAVKLENEYVELLLLPEQGGKIYRALDKKNNYDFIYYNRVIKPQLIGNCGPWASGGIELNWPQHHRPTTFLPVEHFVQKNPDGGTTVWMGEVEPLGRTKGMVGVTLHPGRSYIEAKVRLFNRTEIPQSFMWWANLAVATNDKYRAVFPPDIHWASDHAWAYTTTFPKATGKYGAYDYGAGVDVCDFPNPQIPASFFTYDSKYDFLSGYDFGKDAGVVHVADRHVGTGKKMFTWGNSDFSKAWYDKLTDEDGPYIELMCGLYTCNQPDFSWIGPHEYKTAEQYWYPIHGIGEVKNATLDAAMAMDFEGGKVKIGLNVTGSFPRLRLTVKRGETEIFSEALSMTPEDAPHFEIDLPHGSKPHEIQAALTDESGKALVAYRPEEPGEVKVPEAYVPAREASEIETVDELYYQALHLFQYRHPFLEPETYLSEALRRDPGDARCNTLMGRILLQRSNPAAAIPYFEKARERIVSRNPNPYESEPIYLLGVAYLQLRRFDEAYEALAKAAWDYRWKSASYDLMAMIALRRGDGTLALRNAEEALLAGGGNRVALWIKALTLRTLGRAAEGAALMKTLLAEDPLDHLARQELCLCGGGDEPGFEKVEYALDVALRYELAGRFAEAEAVLQRAGDFLPALYHRAFVLEEMGRAKEADALYRKAAAASPEKCFHKRPESLAVLAHAAEREDDAVAPYLLGNMLYADKQFGPAIEQYERSVARGADFAAVYRVLAFGLFEKKGDKARAGEMMREAARRLPKDMRVFYEYCLYLRNVNAPVGERLALLDKNADLALGRDDACCLYADTLIEAGEYQRAEAALSGHSFHSREGGEGVGVRAHMAACLGASARAIEAGDGEKALALCQLAREIGPNYHEGHAITYVPAHIDFWEGRAHEALGQAEEAQACYRRAAGYETALGNYEALFYAAMALKKLGQAEKAQALAREALPRIDQIEAHAGSYRHFEAGFSLPLPFELDKRRMDMRYVRYARLLMLLAAGEKEKAEKAFLAARAECACDYRPAFIWKHAGLF